MGFQPIFADVAELADAQVSGTCGLSPWRFDSSHPHWISYPQRDNGSPLPAKYQPFAAIFVKQTQPFNEKQYIGR